jgi:hypothetical protein
VAGDGQEEQDRTALLKKPGWELRPREFGSVIPVEVTEYPYELGDNPAVKRVPVDRWLEAAAWERIQSITTVERTSRTQRFYLSANQRTKM